MDAAAFETYAAGATVEDAFRAARRRHTGGDRGARPGDGPDDYIVISDRPIPLADAQKLAEVLLASSDSRVCQPGVAAAIAVHAPAAATLPHMPGPKTPPGGWLFIGRTHH